MSKPDHPGQSSSEAATTSSTAATVLSFGEKLRAWREARGVTLYYIGKVTSIAVPNLVSIEKGRRPASDDVLRKLTSVRELELSYETLKAWQVLDQAGVNAIELAYKESHPHFSEATQPLQIQIRGKVAAGLLNWVEEEDLGEVPWPKMGKPPEGTFALQVSGDSMEPEFLDGCIIYVKPIETFHAEKKYVIQTEDGQTTLKMVKPSEDGLILIPMNKKYKPFPVQKASVERAWEVIARLFVD